MPTADQARKSLKASYQGTIVITPRQAIEIASAMYCVPPDVIIDQNRSVRNIRSIAYLIATVFCEESIAEIARQFERDHTTVMTSIVESFDRLEKDLTFRSHWTFAVGDIERRLKLAKVQQNFNPAQIEPQSYENNHNKIQPVTIDDQSPLTPERRQCHAYNVAYASALYREHGQQARWP